MAACAACLKSLFGVFAAVMLMLVNRDLQNQPQPGENIVSHYVQEAIRGKATVALLDLGDQELKNIARPVSWLNHDAKYFLSE